MYQEHWPEIYGGLSELTGNVGKVKVLHELRRLTSNGSVPRILDIGCIGLQPLDFWKPLLAAPGSQFHLTGIDVKGIEEAKKLVIQRGWDDRVAVLQGSGYDLTKLFASQSFDVVIATQVLEHIARLSSFLQQVSAILKSHGEGFFVVDSAHWRSRFDPCEPVRMMKNLTKKGLSLLGFERHYDLPWFDHEVMSACQNAGLEIIECRFCNLSPLKFIHNHILPNPQKNSFMRIWLELEEFLNEEEVVREKAKHFFLGFYVHFRKS